MNDNIEGLLSSYERGAFTRSEFVAAVSGPLSVPAIGCRHHEAPTERRYTSLANQESLFC
jgi:hypothetical protein